MAYTTVNDPSAYFKVQLYTGDGSANHAITFDDTDTDMQPDLVWIKNREQTDAHMLFDAVRGATKTLSPDSTAGEVTDTDTLDSFASDGFQVDADVKVNTNTEKYVSWNWKGGTTSGIDATGADITPGAYSFNQTAGISIIKYTGNSTSDQDVAHGLAAVPHFIICKVVDADNPQNWDVYHHKNTSAPETDYLSLNLTNATADAVARWQDTAPTSVLFTVGSAGAVNQTGDSIMGYLFSEKQGFSRFGKYQGTNTTDGAFVYTGFKPAWIMVKATNSAQPWYMWDNKREGYNGDNETLVANTTQTGGAGTYLTMLANGFKLHTADNEWNGAYTYVYAAFAEAPLFNSEGVPCNAR